jgi:SH3-like domain-containing protein
MPTEEELQRYRRTREVLAESGWVFDEFINNETRRWLTSNMHDAKGREEAYMRARVATELKVGLMQEIEDFETEKKLAERREQMTGGRDGRDQRPN